MATRAPERPEPVEGLAEEYSDSAPAYARHWAPVLRPYAVRLLDELPLESADRVLDVGAGTGELLPRLRERTSGAQVIGADRSVGMVREARRRGRGPLVGADARSLPFPAGTVDVVTLPFVLFHVPRPAEALREVRRVLRQGGALGLTTWSRESLPLPGEELWLDELDRIGAGSDPRAESVRRYDATGEPSRLVQLLGEAGFPVARCWTRSSARRWQPGPLVDVLRRFGPTGRRLATLPGRTRAPCISRLRRRTRRLSDEELVWRPEVVYGVARVAEGGSP